MIEVCFACLRSGARVSRVIRPSLPSQRPWKKQKPKVS